VLISNIIVAMLLHPHVQKMVHKEIDSLVEAGNIPTWGNRSAAPYLHAVIKEVLRYANNLKKRI
jgi:cytochrome P450